MTGELPHLSVIVPVFNDAVTLPTALASITQQHGARIDIVVDDGSTDDSATVARQFGPSVSCVRQDNLGAPTARNHGLSLASSEFIGFLDADDRWPAGRVEHHIQIFEQTPSAEIVIGSTRIVAMPGNSGADWITAKAVLPAPLIMHQLGSITCRRRIFDRVGLFNPALRIGEDREWFQRILRTGVALVMTHTVAVEYRIRPDSLTWGAIDHAHWFLAALRANLKQRRKH